MKFEGENILEFTDMFPDDRTCLAYLSEQKYSDKGGSMKQMHTIIHQLKSWLRSTYSWVHAEHIEKYLDEYSFRINRSIHKQTIFHNLILRMINAQPITYQMIRISN